MCQGRSGKFWPRDESRTALAHRTTLHGGYLYNYSTYMKKHLENSTNFPFLLYFPRRVFNKNNIEENTKYLKEKAAHSNV